MRFGQACFVAAGIVAAAFVLVGSAGEAQAGTSVSGSYASSQTWTTAGSPYWVTGDLVVRNGATLTIEAGVEVHINGSARLMVGNGHAEWCCGNRGILDVQGTASAPVRFSGHRVEFMGYNGAQDLGSTIRNATFTSSTDWGIVLRQWSNLVIDNATFTDPASGGIYLDGASPTIRSSTFDGGPYGLYGTDWSARPSVWASTFADQTSYHMRVGITSPIVESTYSGALSSILVLGGNRHYDHDYTIRDQAVPYEMVEWAGIRNSKTLTIEPGVRIRASPQSYFAIGNGNAEWCCSNRGVLDAQGTTDAPISIYGFTSTPVQNGYAGTFHFYGWNGAQDLGSVIRNVTMVDQQHYPIYAGAWSALTIDNFTTRSNGSYGVYLTAGSSPSILNSRIVGYQYGVYGDGWSERPTIRNTVLEHQTVVHARVGITSIIDDNVYVGNGSVVQLFGGDRHYDHDFAIRNESVPYQMHQWAGIRNSRTLTIEPGVRIHASPSSYFAIGNGHAEWCCSNRGVLNAVGTSSAPITIQGFTATASQNGYAGTIHFYGWNGAQDLGSTIRNLTMLDQQHYPLYVGSWSALTVDNATLRSSGSYGVYLTAGSSPTVVNSRIVGNQYGVYGDGWSERPTIRGTRFEDQTVAHARVGLTSTIDDNTYAGTGSVVRLIAGNRHYEYDFTIRKEDVPYEMYEWAGIRNSKTLTIEAGTTIRAASDAYFVIGNGNNEWCCANRGILHAAGTALSPIVIESLSGNNTPGHGWNGIYFYGWNGAQDLGSTLRNLTLRNSQGTAIQLRAWHGLTLDHLTIEGARTQGIWFEDADSHTIKHSVFRGMGTSGVHLEPTATGNTFYDNVFASTRTATGANAFAGSSSNTWNVAPGPGPNVCGGPQIGGNAWSDDASGDSNGDGFSDAAYTVQLAGAGDQKPLACAQPTASYVFSVAGALVNFTDQSAAVAPLRLLNWTWNFTDGSPLSYVRHPSHEFPVNGVFPARLTVTDELGRSATGTANVTVSIYPPSTVALLSGTHGANGWYVSPVTIELVANDGVGVANLSYRLDASAPFSAYGGPIAVSGEGPQRVEYYAVNVGGAIEPTKNTTFRLDLTAPTTQATLAGPLGGGGWFTGDVSVSLAANDNVSGVDTLTYGIGAGGELPYAGAFSVSGTGTHAVAHQARDLAGLASALTTTQVHIDVTPPGSTPILSGTLGANGWYTSDVTATLTGSDLGSGVAGLEIGVDGGALGTYAGAVSVTGDSPSHSIVHRATDVAGLVEALRSRTIPIDTTPPTASATVSGTLVDGWYTSAVTITFEASDLTSGVACVEVSDNNGTWACAGSSLTLSSEGTHWIEFRARDAAGLLQPEQELGLVRIDQLAPTLQLQVSGTPGANGWWRDTTADASLAVSDGPGSGVATVSYSVNGSDPLVYSGRFAISGEGIHTVSAAASDLVGHRTELAGSVVRLDATPPTVFVDLAGERSPNGTYTTEVTIAIDGTDATSGVSEIRYGINAPATTLYSGEIVVDLDGDYVLRVSAIDTAGNTISLPEIPFTLINDDTPPVTTGQVVGSLGEEGWLTTAARLRVDVSDSQSPLLGTWVSIDGLPETLAPPPADAAAALSYTRTVDLPVADGWHDLTFASEDLPGNREASAPLSFKQDTVAPRTTIVPSGTAVAVPGGSAAYASDVTITLSRVEATSGLASTRYRVDGGAWAEYADAFVVSGTGRHTVEAFSTDAAGNVEPVRSFSWSTDTLAPDLPAYGTTPLDMSRIVPGGIRAFRANVTIDLSALDVGPDGPLQLENSSIRYRIDGGPTQTYLGPFGVTGEGMVNVTAWAIDPFGNVGLPVNFTFLVDLTTPVLDALIEASDQRYVSGVYYVGAELCFRFPLADPLGPYANPTSGAVVSGLNELWFQLETPAGELVRSVNLTVNEILEQLPLPAEANITLCESALAGGGWRDPVGSGFWIFTGGGCDGAGNCGWLNGGQPFEIVKSLEAPRATIVYPPRGSLSLDDVVLPLYPNAGECVAALAERDLADASAVCALFDATTLAGETVARDSVAHLRSRTVMAGRVPVIVRVEGVGGVAGLDLTSDGLGLRLENATRLAASTNETAYYRFLVDTTTMFDLANATGADALLRTDRLFANATDHLRRSGNDTRTNVTFVNLEPNADMVPEEARSASEATIGVVSDVRPWRPKAAVPEPR